MTKTQRPTPIGDLTFIESQFPVAKMSIESYTERTAKQGQTLTGLGKWWGRKPLVLCRATLLGLLLPATDDPEADRAVFLRLMTMDDDGLVVRKCFQIPAKEMFTRLPPSERSRWFTPESTERAARLKRGLSDQQKSDLQIRIFLSMGYDERMGYCCRPEQVKGPTPESWAIINAHLGTNANSLVELVHELGTRRFGHTPKVGDSFCGGGSIPYEAARLGCDTYGSDLNPVAALLTWSALNVVGGEPSVGDRVAEVQREIYDAVENLITSWEIELREPDKKTKRRWRADAYLYCLEVECPECGWVVPLSPSWVIGKGTKTIAQLIPSQEHRNFNFEVHTEVNDTEMKKAAEAGTVKDSELKCPHCKHTTPIRAIRGDGRGNFSDAANLLRPWENSDLVPRDGDIFGERLYCIRWVDSWVDEDGREVYERHYCAPTQADIAREAKVISILKEKFDRWQEAGFIPSKKIEPGQKTTEPIRTRGWTYWHHLFTPRQLLVNGSFAEEVSKLSGVDGVSTLMMLGRIADWNSRLCRWNPGIGNEKSEQIFSNQALNTLYNFGCRTTKSLENTWLIPIKQFQVAGKSDIRVSDARDITISSDLWITDPPYADAICYEEIADLFLAWYEKRIPILFSGWYAEARRALAVHGEDEDFRKAMVECYGTLAKNMPENGLQVVMFTHQDAAVWADLALILWAAGLRVTAAWCIATETGPAAAEGNYVQGTVIMVLRKRTSTEVAFLDEVYTEVEQEVLRQLDSMKDMEDSRDPNFSDTDYQLAAYAAALRVITSRQIEEIDPAHELARARTRGEISPIEEVIRSAVKIACDHLIPVGIEKTVWIHLTGPERLYLKGLEMERHGEHRSGVYQELARGFSVADYAVLLASTRANETRLRTATDFGRRELGTQGFGTSLLRQILFAVHKTAESDSPSDGITWLRTEWPNYSEDRVRILAILEFLSGLGGDASMDEWRKDAKAATLLAGALRNREDNV